MINNTLSRLLLTLLITGVFLTVCEKNQPSSLSAQTTIKKYEKATTLHGTISNNQGFVENGTVKVTSAGGQLITSTSLQNSRNYSVEIPANTALPLLLVFSSEAGESFTAVVIHPSISKYDINPLTTAIAKKAMSLGGYTDTNMRQAAENSTSVHTASTVSSVDQTKATQHYGGWH